MNHRLSSSSRLSGRQRGSILLQVASALLVCVIALTGTELGYLFFVKREMQKAADLAALAGAKVLATSDCVAGNVAATENAQQNLESLSFPVSVIPSCGRWDPAGNPGNRYFEAGAGQANAVEVLVSGSGPALLPFLSSRLVSARAMAKSGPPLAGFSVGTKLVNVTGNGLLGDSLKMLGLNLTGTSLVGYDGLADVKITPAGLLQELGIPASGSLTIGDLNALLTAQNVSLGNVLDATARAAGRTDLLSANTSLLNAVTTQLGGSGNVNQVRLGSDDSGSSRGLFAHVVSPDTSSASALSTQIRALDIINSAIGVASAGHAVDVDLSAVGLMEAKVAVVEPPSIAFGSVGARAYTAQVRAYTRLRTEHLALGLLLSPLVSLDFPIVIDVTTGKGTLDELCSESLKEGGVDRARINVEASIAKVCAGNIAPGNLFSKSRVCEDNLTNMNMLSIAGLPLLTQRININPLPSNGTVTLKEGETKSVPENGNPLALGTTVSDLMAQLTNQLFGGVPPSGTPSSSPVDQAGNLANRLFDDTASLCTNNNTACRTTRLNAVLAAIQNDTAASGLLSGVVGGLSSITSALTNFLVGNGCTVAGLLGTTSNAGCVTLIKNSLSNASSAIGGGTVNNTVATLAGILKPILNSLGSAVLNPLLSSLGIQLGVTDVHLIKLQCSGEPRLVY